MTHPANRRARKIPFAAKRCLAACFFLCASLWAAAPTHLTVNEFFENPIGYALENLRFNWQLSATQKGAAQTAYQVIVAASPNDFDRAPVWDSGKVESDQSVFVPYRGRPIASRERLYWKVRYWDENGKVSDWSQPAFFEAGLLEKNDRQGQWINYPHDPQNFKAIAEGGLGMPPAYLRKTFENTKPIASARLYASACGIFQAYLNGEKVGDGYWIPGITDLTKRVPVCVYDVSALLKSGKNALAGVVANGWLHFYLSKLWERPEYWERATMFDKYKRMSPLFWAQLEIRYQDGTVQTLATDESWKASLGPIKYSNIYHGEAYDARAELGDWMSPDFDDAKWCAAEKSELLDLRKEIAPKAQHSDEAWGFKHNMPRMEPRRVPEISANEIHDARSVKKLAQGTYVFDIGENISGWARLRLPLKAGQTIRMNFAEILNPDGSLYKESYRDAFATDFYTAAKDGIAEWEPNFTFRGFRYVQISGLSDDAKPALSWVKGVALYNKMAQTGQFACSHPLVNQLFRNIVRSQKSNFFSVPMDCPQRDERLGWVGDAQIYAPTAAILMNTLSFYNKFQTDILDAQSADGCVPVVAPMINYDNTRSSGWGDAIALIPWAMYQAYGDKTILEKSYEGMKRWVDFCHKQSPDFICTKTMAVFGDWLTPSSFINFAGTSKTPKEVIGTAFFAHSADTLSKIARVLGKEQDAHTYAALAQKIKTAFTRVFVSPDGLVKGDAQGSYVLALGFNLVPDSLRAKVAEKFAAAIERDGRHLDTGILTTPLLLPILTQMGRADLAYAIFKQEDFPSWLYPVKLGATSMWERWNTYTKENGAFPHSMNSFNHCDWGVVAEWMFATLAGIAPDPERPGYKNILFAPILDNAFQWAKASIETPYGHAASSWKRDGERFVWDIQIPPNATGTVVFPTEKLSTVRIDGKALPAPEKSVKLAAGNHKITLSL